jgi:hypothetical protein
MRAFLVMLMLTLLPLQFSAAAAAECCGHVAVAQGSQVQHHQPAHISAGSDREELATNGLGVDLDCGTCHANCAAALPATSANMVDPSGIERVEHLVERFLPPWLERPYRPRWSTPNGSGLNAYS